jgi:hypothetical protein
MTQFNEGRRAASFILTEQDGHLSRDNIIVVAGSGILEPGTLLGRLTSSAAAIVSPGEGNTGNGVFTLASPAIGGGVKSGAYKVEVIGGTFAAVASALIHAPGSTANGTLALTGGGGAAFDAGTVLEGTYQVRCTVPAAGGGTFSVHDPNGTVLAPATDGVAYVGQIKFTATHGSADWLVGDGFDVTISHAVPANGLGTFQVTDPDGIVKAGGTIGTAYAHELAFNVADGSANFVPGDTFLVQVNFTTLQYGPSPLTGTDGDEFANAILIYRVDATDVDVKTPAITRLCEVNAKELVYDASVTDDAGKAAKMAQLASVGIVAR